MKKLVVLLSIIVVCLSGCSAKKLDNTDLGKNIKILLTEEVDYSNVYFDGYKFFVPKGLQIISKDEYNSVFLDRNANKYYLYIDAISYYHKTENTYMVDEDIHYSNKLNYNKKTGYINIEEMEGKFYIQFMYNYAKMEAYVNKDDLTSVVNNMCYILRTIEFNDKVLESLIGDNVLSYQEEEFNLFDAEKSNENVLEVVGDNDSKKKTDDKNQIKVDKNY